MVDEPKPSSSTPESSKYPVRAVHLCTRLLNAHNMQRTDTVETDELPSLSPDIERTSEASSVRPLDPYNIREGLVTEEQIAALQQRRKGKGIAKFHKKQNDVKYNLFTASNVLTQKISLSPPSLNLWRNIPKMPRPTRTLHAELYVFLFIMWNSCGETSRSKSQSGPVSSQTSACVYCRVGLRLTRLDALLQFIL
jgi:hypothetical protein